MARSLTQSPPSSTVARLLDVGAAARAIGETASAAAPEHANAVSSVSQAAESSAGREPGVVKRELTLSPAADDVFDQLVELYRQATGARLSSSHLARAMLRGLSQCLPCLQREANRIGRLRLPSNARGHEPERQRFEERIAQAFIAGIRASTPFDAS